jgi:ATP phosphoribosyltransferase regulatory subunit
MAEAKRGCYQAAVMTDDLPPNPALLPAGLRDVLPPDAEAEAAAVARLMAVFASHGYNRVKPPLLEFADTLLAGTGAAVAEQTFRLMDPDSQRMMGLRADTTPQIARIATTRLAAAPRPLRLSYAGQCLLVRGNQIDPDRQRSQAGIELIGHDSPQADAEVVVVGAEALLAMGLTDISFDLTMPAFAPALIDAAGIEPVARRALALALDRKDVASVRAHGGVLAPVLSALLLAAGPADAALAALAAAALPDAVRPLTERLAATVAAIRERAPDLRLTLDPVEFRGFRYETGVCVTVYAANLARELGRGGRYLCADVEPATGLTLYPDTILRAAPPPVARNLLFVPAGEDPLDAAILRGQGFATVAALSDAADHAAEARRLLCTHILRGGEAVAL